MLLGGARILNEDGWVFDQEITGSDLQSSNEWKLVLQNQEQQELIQLDLVLPPFNLDILREYDILQDPLVDLELPTTLL